MAISILGGLTVCVSAQAATANLILGRCSGDVIVVRQTAAVKLFHPRGEPQDLRACAPGATRARELTPGTQPEKDCVAGTCISSIGPTAVRGNWAAVAFAVFGREGSDVLIDAVNVKTGKFVSVSALDLHLLIDTKVGTKVTGLTVGSRGGLGWVLHNTSVSPVADEVHRHDSSGRVVLSASGVAPTSLAQAGDRMYWLSNGQPQTAVLAGVPARIPTGSGGGLLSR